MEQTSAILDFYRGRSRDPCGHSFDEMMGWSFARWEGEQESLAWLFPTDRPNRFHQDSPVLEPNDVDTFREDHALRAKLLQAFDRFLAFLGLRRLADRIEAGPGWSARAEVWLVFGDHIHDRVTTVITSLRLLGFEDEACRFVQALEVVGRSPNGLANIDDGSMHLWRRAAGER